VIRRMHAQQREKLVHSQDQTTGVVEMATDRSNDLRAFQSFIDQKLSNGGPNLTLDEALDLWNIETQPASDREATVKALKQALDDMRAGDTGIPAREFLAEVGRKYDLSERP
jgi:hypothetical protein